MLQTSINNVKILQRSGPCFAFSLPGGATRALPLVSYATDYNNIQHIRQQHNEVIIARRYQRLLQNSDDELGLFTCSN